MEEKEVVKKNGRGRPKGYRKPNAKRTIFNIRIDQEFKLKLEQVAKNENTSSTDIINKALEEYYSKHGYVFDKAELLTKPKVD